MTRVLVVDDLQEWRRTVRQLLEPHPELHVVGEASDGWEAVQRAEELRPDLIVLDIGLPGLNGIEAATRIRERSPNSRIVFLSLHHSPDVLQAALSTAQGYVHKSHAGRDLLAAIDAVLRGERFVSSSVTTRDVVEDAQKLPHHKIVFFSDDRFLLDAFAHIVAVALESGNAAIVVATESHRDSLLGRLNQQGLDVGRAIQEGTYVPLDVTETLSAIMVDSVPDTARFFGAMGGVIEAATEAATAEPARVVVCGEGVAFLQAEGNSDAAIRLGQLCDELTRTHEVDVLCAYRI